MIRRPGQGQVPRRPRAVRRGNAGVRRPGPQQAAGPKDKRHILETRGSVDVAYPLPGLARFRTNIFHSRERLALVMRRIVTKIPNFEELNLPTQIEKMAELQRGVVFVSGTTGSGKSTTLAAVIGKNHRNPQ